MAVAFGAAATAAAGTTSATLTWPSTIVAGDMLLIYVASKYPPNIVATPTGYTLLVAATGGSGSSGVDAGQVYSCIFYKIADGSEQGTTTVVTNASANAIRVAGARYTKSVNAQWDIAGTTGSFNTPATSISVTGAANPGLITGDMLVATMAVNTDNSTYSAEAFTATGVTFGSVTERYDSQTTQGDDMSQVGWDASVTAGPATSAPSTTVTATVLGTDGPAGAIAFCRLREVVTSNLTYQSFTIAVNGTTSCTPTYPSSLASGDLILLVVMGRYPANYPTTPTGFTLINIRRSTSGVSPGAGVGDNYCAAYYKISNGTETGSVTVSVTSGNVVCASMYRISAAAGYTYAIASAGGSWDAAAATAITWTYDSNPGIVTDDLCLVLWDGSLGAYSVTRLYIDTGGAIIPMGNQVNAISTTTGDDERGFVYEGMAIGTSTAAGAMTALTNSASVFSSLLIRIRAVPAITLHHPNQGIFRGIFPGIQPLAV